MNFTTKRLKLTFSSSIAVCTVVLFSHSSHLFSQSDSFGFAKIPLTKNYSTEDYKGGIQNWGLCQDERGYMYIANNFGLLEYDGSTWQIYSVENNTKVRSVFTDNDGKIYIGGQNQFGYFEPNEIGVLTFNSLYDSLPLEDRDLEDVWRIMRYNDVILFSTYKHTIAYDGKKVEKIKQSGSLGLLYKVAQDIYGYSQEYGFFKLNNLEPVTINIGTAFQAKEIRGIIPFQSNSLLVFLKTGEVYRYQNQKFQPWFNHLDDFLSQGLINDVLLLKNNNIAIGTQNNGSLIINQQGNTLHHLTIGRGLGNRTVLSHYEDQFGNLWAGLNNGITKIELASPFSIINEQSGLPGTGYCALIYDNGLYLGTTNGLYYQRANADPLSPEANYTLIENTGGQVYNIQPIDGDLMLSHHSGAFIIENNKATNIFGATGVWKFLEKIKKEEAIVGTYQGFQRAKKINGKYSFTKVEGFSESSRVLEFSSDSTLFMTHGYKGIFKIELNKDFDKVEHVDFYGLKNGLPSDILINVFSLGSSKLIFAASRGLYTYDLESNTFIHDDLLEKHLGKEVHITEMAQDIMGNIYFIGDQGIGYLELTAHGDYIKHTDYFSRIEQYLSDDLENISALDHENVLFGAKEGFIHFNPSMPIIKDQPFRTFIRSINTTTDEDFNIYGGTGDLSSINLSLPAYFSSLRIQYASPYFEDEDKLQYQYQLENFDTHWSDWTTSTVKEYTNLSEGTYTFKVRAINTHKEVSEIESYSFSVYPPWYRTKLAYGLYGLAFFLIFGIYMYILEKRFRKQKKHLTIKQERELLKKDHQIVEVSKKSEEAITKLKNDKLRAEIDHKNRELATTTMHLINKNEFMLTIRETLKESAKTGVKDQFKKIIRDIDRNLSEDEGWEQFTKHFDQVHGEFLSNIKNEHPTLTPQEIKLCAYLRMNMSSKEIANLLNISVRGVEISRYRLRKKLAINRDTNLIEYMLEFS